MQSPQEFIKNIENELTLSDIGKNENEKRAIDKVLKRLNNALEKLSVELYKKDTHFFLELIQNADDNDYSDEVTPFIKFLITQKRIIIQNNELGFTEENVRSLCDVGESTKCDRYKGYIGEKGIGFKSVFKISDSPQIFSNGFHFKFRRENTTDKLGFIVPYWIDNIPNYISLELTNIVLPFNQQGKNQLIEQVTNITNEINHAVILFLNRIKEIKIMNEVSKGMIQIVRTELNGKIKIEELIEQQCKNTGKLNRYENQYFYQLIEQKFQVPNNIEEEKRGNVKETQIILGFPLNEQGESILVKQQVFAYLPIQESGFKFLIQADFILPSTRENIDNDNKWNKWLLENISLVFLEAVEYFKQHNKLKYQYYNYLPKLEEIVDSQFLLIAKNLYDLLKNHDCILTSSGKWCKPGEVLFVDEGIKNIFSSKDIYQLIGKEYISDKLNCQADSNILKQLGVQKFSSNDLLKCLSNTKFLNKKSDDWLVKLYEYLYEIESSSKISINALKDLEIIRLDNADNLMVSVNENDIFFYISYKEYYGLDEVRTLKKISSKKAENFLKNIGVIDSEPMIIIRKYIIPIFKNDSWKDKGNKNLVCLLKYIRNQKTQLTQNDISVLTQTLWIKNNHPNNCQFSRSDNLYFSRDYSLDKNNIISNDIDQIIESNEFISLDYIRDESDIEINLWKEFFTLLGVRELSATEIIKYIIDIYKDKSKWTNKKDETLFICLEYIKTKYQYIDDLYLYHEIKSSVYIRNSHPEVIDNTTQLCYSKANELYAIFNSNKQDDDLEFFLELVEQNNYFVSNDYFKNSSEINEWHKFLKWLGVKEITPYEIIKNFILPLYQNNDKSKNYLSKSKQINIKCVHYVKDNFEAIAKDKKLLKDIQEFLWIQCYNPTTKSTAYWRASNLYFSKEYNNIIDLECLFENIKDVEYVSFLYLKQISTDDKSSQSTEAVDSWKSFFINLGVNQRPKTEIFSSIISLNEYKRNELLLKILDQSWKDYKSQCEEKSYASNEATWFTKLKNSSWIPTTNKSLAQPSEIFIDKPNIRKILDNNVLYVGIQLTNKEFIKDINIQITPTVSAILDKLKQLSKSKSQDKAHLTELYQLLLDKFNEISAEEIIKTAFKENSLIYIQNTSQIYFSFCEVFWKNHSNILGKKLRGYLQDEYPTLYDFFVNKLEIKQDLTIQDYANILLDLSKQKELISEDKQIILKAYRRLDKYLDLAQIKDSWWQEFIQKQIVYTHRNQFSQNHENLFINDDEQLFSLFSNKDSIDFLQLSSDNSHHQIENLIKAINIKYISLCVEVELSLDETHQKTEALEVTQQIQTFFPYILRYLYDRETKIFKQLKNNQTFNKFQELQCYTCHQIKVKYILQVESVLTEKEVFLDKNNNQLYIQNNYLTDTDRFAIELAKFFGNVKGLEDFLIALFDKKNNKNIEKYLNIKKISNLPTEEKQYFGFLESDLVDKNFLKDKPEKIIEIDNSVIEDDNPQINFKSSDKFDSNFDSDDQSVSLQQSRNQSATKNKPSLNQTEKNQNSNSKENHQNHDTEVNNLQSQSNYQKIQNPSKSNIQSSKTTDKNLSDNVDLDEINDINWNLTNNVDTRERITTEIVQRPEQAEFRNRLLKIYNGRCVITDYEAEKALMAAHIIPYKISQDNRPSNGLLLRADIHILFDRYLILIDPETMIVRLDPRLTNTKYAELESKKLNIPKVSNEALEWHCHQCKWF